MMLSLANVLRRTTALELKLCCMKCYSGGHLKSKDKFGYEYHGSQAYDTLFIPLRLTVGCRSPAATAQIRLLPGPTWNLPAQTPRLNRGALFCLHF